MKAPLRKSEFVIAIDGGASRTRCALFDRNGVQIGYAEAGASNYYGLNAEQTSHALTTAITSALHGAELSVADASYLVAGMASVGPDGENAAEVDLVLQRMGFARCRVVGDLIIAHAGALAHQPGVLVIAGTGSSCIGIAAGGRKHKIGGWGPTYGDEGSGYYIGRAALNAAARAYDNYGPPTMLVEFICQALGISDFRQSLERIYQPEFSVRQMAGLAEATVRAAAAGDAVANSILTVAAGDLAAMAVSVLQRLFPGDSAPLVSFAGSLLVSCEAIQKRFAETIRQAVPNAQVVPPRYSPCVGAFLLACSTLGWTPAPDFL